MPSLLTSHNTPPPPTDTWTSSPLLFFPTGGGGITRCTRSLSLWLTAAPPLPPFHTSSAHLWCPLHISANFLLIPPRSPKIPALHLSTIGWEGWPRQSLQGGKGLQPLILFRMDLFLFLNDPSTLFPTGGRMCVASTKAAPPATSVGWRGGHPCHVCVLLWQTGIYVSNRYIKFFLN